MKKSTIKKLMDKLYKQLSEEYPARHWNHVRVWTAYWQLKELVLGK